MSRLPVLAAILGLFASACGSSDNSATTPTTTAPPTKVVLSATLRPSEETPAAVGPETAGSGSVSITMNMTRDSGGNITAATVDFLATMSGFPAGTVLTAAHIHKGLQGCSCPVVVNTTITNGEIVLTNGSGSIVKNGIPVTPVDTANLLLNDPSSFYFNIHT